MQLLIFGLRILRGEDEIEPRLLRHVQNIKYRRKSATLKKTKKLICPTFSLISFVGMLH